MTFEEIPGQEAAKTRLATMIDSGRLPHALLLLGPRGCGKLALALAGAQRLLCVRRQQGQPCRVFSLGDQTPPPDACPHCRKAARLLHPDLHFSYPTVKRNPRDPATSEMFRDPWRAALLGNPWMDLNAWLHAISSEKKQGNINAAECTSIIRKINLKPFEADKRVLIMWLPEWLGEQGNRLLKLIEEPPEGAYFLLVAEDSERILPTLLSRCQLLRLGPLSDEEVEKGLIKRFPALGSRAASIAFQAQGNFDEALRLAREREDDNGEAFVDWLRRCYVGNGVSLVGWTEGFAKKSREDQISFLRYGLQFLRELLVLKALGTEHARLAEEQRNAAEKLQSIIGYEQVEGLSEVLTGAIQAVERNANPKILFLDASIRMHRILKRKIHPAREPHINR